MNMDRRQFLQSLAAAVAVSLVPKALVPDLAAAPTAAATYRAAEASLRPAYLAWLNEAKYHRLLFLAIHRPEAGVAPTIVGELGAWAGEGIPAIELRLQKLDLPRGRAERLAVLLALQERHPWPADDWRAEMQRKGDRASRAEMHDAFKGEHGFLPRVYSPADLHKMGVVE